MAWRAFKSGRIDELIAVALVAHHLIRFAQDCTRQRATFFNDRPQVVPSLEQAA